MIFGTKTIHTTPTPLRFVGKAKEPQLADQNNRVLTGCGVVVAVVVVALLVVVDARDTAINKAATINRRICSRGVDFNKLKV